MALFEASARDHAVAPGRHADARAGHPGARASDFELDELGFREFLPIEDDIVAARRFVRETLEANGAAEDLLAGAELVVDELALNAVQHAGTFFSVLVESGPDAVKVAVRDDSNVFPHPREHVLLSIGGRGLSIVRSTALQWGAESLGRGKEVWALLRQH